MTGVAKTGNKRVQFPGEMIMNCSWTFMNSSWMFVNKKLWTFMNVHQRVHERFMNILEQQMRLSWKFMSSWTYSVHELTLFTSMGCSWTVMNSDNSWTRASSWTTMNSNEHSWTFLKCVHELFMNVPEQQMRHSWMQLNRQPSSWTAINSNSSWTR